MSTGELHVFAKVVAQEDKADEVRAVLTELVSAIRKENGVIKYHLHEDISRPGAFMFAETYENEAMLDAHRKSAAFGKAFSAIKSMLAARRNFM